MATGAGKTFTACTFSYRLLAHAKFGAHPVPGRPRNLGTRPTTSSRLYAPRHRQLFTEIYNAQSSAGRRARRDAAGRHLDHPARLLPRCAAEELAEEIDEQSAFEVGHRRDRRSAPFVYNPAHPDRELRSVIVGRMPPLDLRHLAAGARLFRRLHHRPDRDAVAAHARLFQPEPRRPISLRALGRRWRQRRLRGLPHPHRDRRAGRRSRRATIVPVRDRRTRASATRSWTTISAYTPATSTAR